MSGLPFTVDLPDTVLDDLRARLAATRWTDAVAEGWGYGIDLDYLRELAGTWEREFDWRAQERELNRHPQFHSEIDGTGVHFVHVRGQGPDPMPLLLLHGWPSTFFQMHKIIPLLTDPGAHGGDPADSFERGGPEPARLRLLGPTHGAGDERGPHRRAVHPAHGHPRL